MHRSKQQISTSGRHVSPLQAIPRLAFGKGLASMSPAPPSPLLAAPPSPGRVEIPPPSTAPVSAVRSSRLHATTRIARNASTNALPIRTREPRFIGA